MKDLTDFAVIARSASTKLSNLGKAVLRVVPLGNTPTLTEALGGLLSEGTSTFNPNQNMTLELNGSISKSNIHSVQDRSNGYVRVVARINGSTLPEGVTHPNDYPESLTNALGFALLNGIVEGEGENAHVTGWEVLAVASLKAGCDVTDGCYVAFTFSKTNNYQSVSFSPNAFATIEDLDNINGLDGLHIAFDTASGDLKLLDKDGNVLDQANLPIKADVIIADGEEGYKYVKTDVKQDIHAAKAWMPKGSTAWEAVGEVQYTRKHAALVVGKGSTPASRMFVCTKPIFASPISTESVPLEHVVIGDSTYMLVDKNGTTCDLHKVKGEAGEPVIYGAGISDTNVTLNNDQSQSYPITNGDVKVDVIKAQDSTITHVIVGTNISNEFRALSIDGASESYSGIIVTFGGSSAASRVFVDPNSGSFPISTESVPLEHVVIDGSTYLLVNKNETTCDLHKVKGEAGEPVIYGAGISDTNVTLNNDQSQSYPITNGDVKVDVIKAQGSTITHVIVGTDIPNEFRALPIDGASAPYFGTIVTFEGSSTGEVLGITPDGTNLYTFDEGAQSPTHINNISGGTVRWLDRKPLNEVTNHTLKYGLEAFVWTVKDAEAGKKIIDPFFKQLNNSLLDLGFHEGDDIALGTNLATLAPAEGVSPLNRVDADEYMHGETINASGKTNKESREQEVDEQRKFAKDELVEWNKQHPALVHDGKSGTRISKDGLDVRNGKIEIGNGVANADDDSVKRYVIETDIDGNARTDQGLQISVVDSQTKSGEGEGATYSDVKKDILTINAEDYISGAPTCLALLKCHKDSKGLTADLTETTGEPDKEVTVNVGRITANFTASGAETDGGFTLTITDNRANNGFGFAPRIVEIIPVYKSGADASEAVPAQRSISAIADADTNTKKTLSIRCSQVIDWAQSIDLGGTVGTTSDDPNATQVPPDSGNYVKSNGMELYLIVKVY